MRRKKLISLLLVISMFVSMIPLNSLAAITPSADSDVGNIKLMISDSFGSDEPIKGIPPMVPDDVPITTPDEYKAAGEQLGVLSFSETFSGKTPQEVVEKLDSVFTPDEDNALDAVKPGDVVYVAVKGLLEQPSGAYKGVVKYTARLIYDPEKLELLVPNADNATNKTQFQNTVVTNLLGKNQLNKSLSGDDSIKYSANFTLDTGSAVGDSTDDPGKKIITIISGSTTTKYMPSASTWDYIIPMRVKEGAQVGETTISSVQIDGTNSAEVVIGKNENGTDVTANGTTTKYNDTSSPEHLKSNDVTINIVKYSDVPTGTEENYTGSVINRTNAPYVGIDQVQDAQKDSVYDYITFPAAETIQGTKGFREGDTIVVYGDEFGNTELGRTVLNEANMFDDTLGWSKGTLDTDAEVAEKTFRLVDENNYGYIKDQSKIWIGRLEEGATHVDKDSLIGIAITPETTLHYAGDAEAVKNGKPGTLENPIEVNLGDTVGSVKEQLFVGDYATTFSAPVEQGSTKSTVEVTVDWKNLQAQTGYVTGEGDDATFSVHGVTKLFVPFPETVEDGITYTNPTAAIYWDTDSFKENNPVPQYGAAIYVKVNPIAADYYLKNPGSGTATAGIIGKTASFLKAADEVEFYKDKEGSVPFYRWTLSGNAQDGVWKDATVSGEGLPQNGESVYLKVIQNSVQPAAKTDYIEVLVTNGTDVYVAGDVTVKGEGPNGEVVVDTQTTFADILEQIQPLTFRLTGYTDEVPLTLDAPYDSVVVKKDGQGDDVGTDVFAQTNSEDVYTVEYIIPAGSTQINNSPVPYTNPKSYKLTFSTISIDRLDIGDGENGEDQNYGLTVTADKNQPNGNRNDDVSTALEDTDYWDLITITGDTKGQVKEGDKVYVYKADASESFTDGVVYKKTETLGDPATYTYQVKVKQLGRTPNYEDLRLTISRDGTDVTYIATPKLKFTSAIPEEEFELQELLPFDPEEVKIKGEFATLNDVYTAAGQGTITLPNAAAGTYARYSETVPGVLDESTSVTRVFDLKTVTWSGNESSAADGQSPSTATVNTADFLAGQKEGNADIVGKNDQETLTIKIKAVTDGYDDLPDGTVPPVDELINSADSKIRNNAFPQTDKVTIADPVPGTGEEVEKGAITVYAYTSEANAKARLPIAKVTLNRDGSADDATIMAFYSSIKDEYTDADKSVLSRDGGSLWFTAETDNTAPSAAVQKAYDVEDFTLLSTDIVPENLKTIDINLEQFKTAVDGGTGKVAYVTEKLPETLTITVGHVKRAADGITLETVGEKHQVVMPTGTWYTDVQSATSKTPLKDEDLPTDRDTEMVLYAVAEQEALKDVSVVLAQDGEVSAKIPVYYGEQTGTYADRTEFYYRASTTLTIKVDNPTLMEIPEPAEDHITASTNNTVNKDDDSIVIDFKGLEPDMANKNVTITIPGEPETTLKGTLDENGQLTIDKENTPTSGDFTGFPENGTTITVVFDDDEGSSSREVQVTVDPVSGAYDLTSVKDPSAITIASGSVHKMEDLLTYVKKIEKADAMSGEVSIKGVPLVKTDAGQGAQTVKWTLRKATGSESIDWSKAETVEGTDLAWETAFAAYDADVKFALTADITDSTAEDGNNITNSLNLVAAVPVTVYDINDPQSSSLKITQGNSDLYTYGAESDEPAYKYIQKQNETNGTSLTNEAFYADAIFYYYYDSYDGYGENGREPVDAVRVSAYTGQSAITEVGDLSGEGLQTWLTDNPDNWDVLQLDENGEPVSEKTYGADGGETGTTNNIDPRNSLDKTKYVVPDKTYERLEENYIIRYVVEYNGQIYTADRRVKLTYMPGDVNFDQLITPADSIDVVNITGSSGEIKIFRPTESDMLDEEKVAELQALDLKLSDINSDNLITPADGIDITNIVGSSGALMPNLRW